MLVIARNATSDSDEYILFSLDSMMTANSVGKTVDVLKTQENIQVENPDQEIEKLKRILDQMHILVQRFRNHALRDKQKIMQLQQTKT